MALTPPQDSKFLEHSSTPLTRLPPSRKRKLEDSLDSSLLASPKFSSTFNESLISNFKEFHLVEGSLAATPEKQLKLLTKTVVASPIQESRKILYSSIKVVKPERKFGHRVKLVAQDSRNLLESILNINVIMDVVFKYLSGGDLFRISLVSQSFYRALEKNASAFNRYRNYKDIFRDNKENYVITPPGSPEKCDSPPRTTSENLNKFIRVGNNLKGSQRLGKCWECRGVTIIQSEISQCQSISCGLIYCLLCSSMSKTGPANFNDLCGHAVLRTKLENVSNTMGDSLFNFSSQDSGFYSENDSSTPKVKRNLFSTCTSAENSRVLMSSNRNRTMVVTHKKRDQVSFVEVIANKDQVRSTVDCESPPRYIHAVGSKQSKRNLKRLTR